MELINQPVVDVLMNYRNNLTLGELLGFFGVVIVGILVYEVICEWKKIIKKHNNMLITKQKEEANNTKKYLDFFDNIPSYYYDEQEKQRNESQKAYKSTLERFSKDETHSHQKTRKNSHIVPDNFRPSDYVSSSSGGWSDWGSSSSGCGSSSFGGDSGGSCGDD